MLKSRQQRLLENHVSRLRRCRRCPRVIPPPVSGGAIISGVMVIGQAPGVREPTLKRPFAHTAGKTLFRWFEEFCGLDEPIMRSRIYFAAVIRCFPGKSPGGSDRVPVPDEIRNCSTWMNAEFEILRPRLVIPVGRLAIMQFIDCKKLDIVIGRSFLVSHGDRKFRFNPVAASQRCLALAQNFAGPRVACSRNENDRKSSRHTRFAIRLSC